MPSLPIFTLCGAPLMVIILRSGTIAETAPSNEDAVAALSLNEPLHDIAMSIQAGLHPPHISLCSSLGKNPGDPRSLEVRTMSLEFNFHLCTPR